MSLLSSPQFLRAQQVLDLGAIDVLGKTYTHDEALSRFTGNDEASRHIRDSVAKQQERISVVRAMPHHKLLQDALATWRSDPDYLTEARPDQAAQTIALYKELENNSRPNDVALYRGARRDPVLDAAAKPVSFTEKRPVAYHFAKYGSVSGEGRIYTAGAGKVSGIRMRDYDVSPGTIGGHREDEWIVARSGLPAVWNDRRKKA